MKILLTLWSFDDYVNTILFFVDSASESRIDLEFQALFSQDLLEGLGDLLVEEGANPLGMLNYCNFGS